MIFVIQSKSVTPFLHLIAFETCLTAVDWHASQLMTNGIIGLILRWLQAVDHRAHGHLDLLDLVSMKLT